MTRPGALPRGPVLVTGATGFIGAAVARALLRHGYAVRVLVRAGADQGNLAGLGVARVEGDLREPESLAAALRGCSALVHTAADYRFWTPDPEAMYRTNVRGTGALLDAAERLNVARVVYTSSVATLAPDRRGVPADEARVAPLEQMTGHYKRSKWLAEKQVIERAGRGLPVTLVNPTAPLGPGDVKPTPTGRIVRDALAGRMPAYVDTGLNVVHVDDVAEGHVLALERGRPGRRYILGGDDMTLRDILSEVCRLAGRRPPRVRLPLGLILPVAGVCEAVARVTGKPPLVELEAARLARRHMYFSSTRAVRELGYRPRPGRAAIADAVAWFAGPGGAPSTIHIEGVT